MHLSSEEERIQLLDSIKTETKRFLNKLEKAKKQLREKKGLAHYHDYAAAKRAALDLKRELTKLTK